MAPMVRHKKLTPPAPQPREEQGTAARAPRADAIARRVSESFKTVSRLPSHARARILAAAASRIEAEAEEFARLIAREVSKPLKEARREVSRAVFTFRWASEEARRVVGELMPLDIDPGGEGRLALSKRVPRGPALFITPFNFPLNLVAHKVAPALAVGVSFALKPAPQAVGTAEKLLAILRGSGWPEDAAALADLPVPEAEALVLDDRLAILSFTGSAAVGWHLKSIAGKKHVLLELGGNASVFVGADADLAWAAQRTAWGAYYYSGQVCISTQRIFVESAVYPPFKEMLLKHIADLKLGEALDDKTDIAPVINEAAAQRLESWIKEAKAAGGQILAGGNRRGLLLEPTLIEGVPPACKLSAEEAFGPVATIEPVSGAPEAFRKMAESRYGLQAGIFTRNLKIVLEAWDDLPVGGLIVNDIPAFRSDAMPYGGVKDSGIGREGVRYAMEEFTELRTLVLRG